MTHHDVAAAAVPPPFKDDEERKAWEAQQELERKREQYEYEHSGNWVVVKTWKIHLPFMAPEVVLGTFGSKDAANAMYTAIMHDPDSRADYLVERR